VSTWRIAQGRKPNTSAERVFVLYRCGLESKAAYPTHGQRWSHENNDFDIVAYRVPEEEQQDRAA
jgi:hypothetical protein